MNFIGLQKLSLVDYDNKTACTLFTGGCNFKCPFCHNSELVEFSNDIKEYTMEEIISFLKTRIGLLDAVCITGGEPTLMNDLKEKIKKIKELGFLVKLDSNGTNPKLLKELVEEKLVDYIAMDIKNDFDNYEITIGKKVYDKDKIMESIEFLKENKVDYEFRTTLIKEFHDFEKIKNIAIIIKGAKKYCLQKFVDSGKCFENNLHEISIDDVKKYKEYLSKYCNEVKIRGYDI